MQHILIVDDDARICILLYRILTREGFIVSTVSSTDKAEEIALYLEFDAIITDVKMPQKSGYDFVQNIRDCHTPFDILIPVMMISAGLEKEQRIKGILKGADDYLVKPFEVDELIIRLKSLLRRAKAPSYQLVKEKEEKNGTIIRGDYILNRQDYKLKFFDKEVNLSKNERDMLAFLMDNHHITFTRYELIQKFFNETKINNDSRAIDVMIARLRKKILTLTTSKECPLVTKRNEGYLWQL